MIAPLLEKLPLFRILPMETAAGRKAAASEISVGRSGADPSIPRRPINAMRQKTRKSKQLLEKLESGKRATTYVVSPASFEDFPTTETGWAGKDFRYKTDQQWLQQAWLDESLLKSMQSQGFQLIAFDGLPTWLVDKNGVVFGYRTDVPKWMTELVVLDERTISLLGRIDEECKAYVAACGDISDKDSKKNRRGPHWFHVSGVDRQISSQPKYTSFHLKHLELTDALMDRRMNSALRRLVLHASNTYAMQFPSLAARVWNCRDRLLAMGVHPDIAIPQYGCWYNFCINASRGQNKGVFTRPHADAKNLALMMCAVFVYGRFDSKEKAWLVLWEAGLIIEVPPGALIYYPSALFTHFNVNLTDLQFVTTSDGALPTPQTASPLDGVEGRGSIVLFNQASLFQYAELGSTVSQAKQRGMSASCDNEEYVDRLPVVDLY
ncbi:hypothetical protein LXA43DRAFT_1028896 [Ganoderma leucocontextum]|nr:hypothetical protein LXA43DRAFT_1028896 [Ganoderma leucocontextum]